MLTTTYRCTTYSTAILFPLSRRSILNGQFSSAPLCCARHRSRGSRAWESLVSGAGCPLPGEKCAGCEVAEEVVGDG